MADIVIIIIFGVITFRLAGIVDKLHTRIAVIEDNRDHAEEK